MKNFIKVHLIALSLILTTACAARADLGIDRYVFLKEPVQIDLKYDFDNTNTVYYFPSEFVLCGKADGTPNFSYHSFKTDQNQRVTIIDFKLCNQLSDFGSNELVRATKEMTATNPHIVFQIAPASHVLVAKDFFAWPFENEIESFCSEASESPTKLSIDCRIQKIGDEPLKLKDHLQQSGASDLLSVFYPGSMQNADGTRLRTSQASKLVWRIDPLISYPDLFVSE
ncbi:MAG: hypothetical protein EOP06_20155 [Proteobacteria bacterium]|nr:MAG: hypothetical protein EOP06_20155 [Pseudomonadota bacterium]